MNEENLVAALERIGYVTVAPEALTPAEQVALFAQARVILGPVGSAFALSGLAAPGTSIVEILPPPAAHSWIYRRSPTSTTSTAASWPQSSRIPNAISTVAV